MFMQDISRETALPANSLLFAPTGLTADTMIETAEGWRPAEELQLGDRIHTLDGGLRRVQGLTRQWLRPGEDALVHIACGSFDNCEDLFLPEGQLVLVETDEDPLFPEMMVALVPALALVGCNGVTRHVVRASMELIVPHFAHEEVIWVSSGVQLFCPAVGHDLSLLQSVEFTVLDLVEARSLLARRRHDRSAMPLAA